LVGAHFIRWIAVYQVDKVIRPLNNWGLVFVQKKKEKKATTATTKINKNKISSSK